MNKNIIVVTGGCGFIGSNLIRRLILKTNYNIISLDNYETGTINNHVKSKKVKYLKGDINEIDFKLKKYSDSIKTIFHFGEFSRIHQSFIDIDKCLYSNISGTSKVFYFALKNRIKIIYSATSASLGNNGKDKSLSPYAFTKSKNLQLLNHLNKWFGLSFEALYFYNVYGPGHIREGKMATVVGIFEKQFELGKPLTVTKPGTQSRKFTHIDDTINGCIYAWKKNKNRHYSLSNMRSYTILQLAKLFNTKIKFTKEKFGERKKSLVINKIGKTRIYKINCTKNLKEYIAKFKLNLKKI